MADSTHPHPSRPPLLRGNTVPLYVRTLSTPVGHGHDQGKSQAELAAAAATAANGPLSARADSFKGYASRWEAAQQNWQAAQSQQHTGGSAPAPTSSSRHAWQIGAFPPTPPLSTSPGSCESSCHEDAYFPPTQGYGRAAHAHPHSQSHAHPHSNSHPHPHAYSHSQQQQQQQHYYSSTKSKPPSPLSTSASASASAQGVCSPTVSDAPSSFQLLRNTRGASAAAARAKAEMRIATTQTEHLLSAAIGPGFDSSCITIAARKGNILDIVADRWDCEKDCHHEWSVQFDRDADMGGIRANYADGVLTVTVKRLNHAYARPPQMRP